ncbi:hypothetical protein BJ508DRAFT_240549 [Ascobolus immersus RN42]|uniref:H-type lectin domain-containing protein n=1 Tax=Ascobolus immersus RN42 TaxID=1160509 RepID=A0A3N4I0J5_ASCIM|nr:hypothetical protein BJ508DRAFT_240549 [Ascobolus immersus RN42]
MSLNESKDIDGTDKVFINWLELPAGDSHNEIPLWQHGEWYSRETLPDNSTLEHTGFPIRFPKRFRTEPKVVLFLSGINTDCTTDLTFFIYASDTSRNGFKLVIDIWNNSKLHGLKVSWVAYASESLPGVCSGSVDTHSFRKNSEPQHYNTSYVSFPTGMFTKPPKVLAGLDYLDFESGKELNIRTFVSNVSIHGMCWHANSSGGTVNRGTGVFWVAYASESVNGVYSGSASTLSFRSESDPQHHNMGYVAFPSGKFTKPPKVMIGLDQLHLAGGTEQNIKAFVSNVSTSGMCWNADSWGDTVNYSAGISFLAIEED